MIVVDASVVAHLAFEDCSTYDCEYAALAMELGVRLVTLDRQLLDAFPSVAASP